MKFCWGVVFLLFAGLGCDSVHCMKKWKRVQTKKKRKKETAEVSRPFNKITSIFIKAPVSVVVETHDGKKVRVKYAIKDKEAFVFERGYRGKLTISMKEESQLSSSILDPQLTIFINPKNLSEFSICDACCIMEIFKKKGKIELCVSGKGLLKIDNLQAPTVGITTESAGELLIDTLEAQKVYANCYGGSQVMLDGVVQYQSVVVHADARYHAGRLCCEDCKIKTYGKSRAKVVGTGDLNKLARGDSLIDYEGFSEVKHLESK